MGAKHLSKRDTSWVGQARATGDSGETDFTIGIKEALPSHYRVESQPSKIVLYSNGKGVVLDHKITNTISKKCLFVEKKKGDAGTGNAHERAGKFLSKKIQESISAQYNTVEDPIFFVFSGKTFNQDNDKGLKYREELEEMFYYSNYAILGEDYSNYKEIAQQIMEII